MNSWFQNPKRNEWSVCISDLQAQNAIIAGIVTLPDGSSLPFKQFSRHIEGEDEIYWDAEKDGVKYIIFND